MASSHPFDVYKNSRSLYQVEQLPYVAIPLEEITSYTNLPDYTTDRIKNINTVGILKPMNFFEMVLRSTSDNEKAKIKLDIKNLYSGAVFHGPGVDPKDLLNKAVRVFGCLTRQDEVIQVDHFSTVDNVERCEGILRLMAQVARQRISAYQYDPTTSPEIRYLVDQIKMDNQRKETAQVSAEEDSESLEEEIDDEETIIRLLRRC